MSEELSMEQMLGNGNKLLSFEEFTRRNGRNAARYTNISLHFRHNFFSEPYRNTCQFKHFQLSHPELERKLDESIANADQTKDLADALKPVEKELYKFYIIMRSYGASDETIFS